MPNIKRLKASRKFFEFHAEGKLDMSDFQHGIITSNLEQFHTCGNKACIAGFVGLQPDFRAAGGHIGDYGTPIFKTLKGSLALSEWWGISDDLGSAIVTAIFAEYRTVQRVTAVVDGVEWGDWTHVEALKIIDAIIDGRLE